MLPLCPVLSHLLERAGGERSGSRQSQCQTSFEPKTELATASVVMEKCGEHDTSELTHTHTHLEMQVYILHTPARRVIFPFEAYFMWHISSHEKVMRRAGSRAGRKSEIMRHVRCFWEPLCKLSETSQYHCPPQIEWMRKLDALWIRTASFNFKHRDRLKSDALFL